MNDSPSSVFTFVNNDIENQHPESTRGFHKLVKISHVDDGGVMRVIN